ncbi:MAG: hypothetical protein WA001_02755 [Patescibacteria group bacterium]
MDQPDPDFKQFIAQQFSSDKHHLVNMAINLCEAITNYGSVQQSSPDSPLRAVLISNTVTFRVAYGAAHGPRAWMQVPSELRDLANYSGAAQHQHNLAKRLAAMLLSMTLPKPKLKTMPRASSPSIPVQRRSSHPPASSTRPVFST